MTSTQLLKQSAVTFTKLQSILKEIDSLDITDFASDLNEWLEDKNNENSLKYDDIERLRDIFDEIQVNIDGIDKMIPITVPKPKLEVAR